MSYKVNIGKNYFPINFARPSGSEALSIYTSFYSAVNSIEQREKNGQTAHKFIINLYH